MRRLARFALPLALTVIPGIVAGQTAGSYGNACTAAAPATPVYPGNATWSADLRVAASLAITGANPRSGNGSLELGTSGDLFDWAFYQRLAPVGGWGLLSELECLSFDWYRASLATPTDVPWSAQTPVLRLLVDDGGTLSELVWEKYYTDGSPTANDVWQFEDLIGQNFWRVLPGSGYTIAGCGQVDPFFPNPLLTQTLSGWSGSCFSSRAFVSAVSVGVGSNWPYQYRGYVDNVRLGFTGQNLLAVNDNFELAPVPEPSTVILLATGLGATLAAGWVRRRRGAAEG